MTSSLKHKQIPSNPSLDGAAHELKSELFLEISSLVFASLDKETLLNQIGRSLNKNFSGYFYVVFLNSQGEMELELARNETGAQKSDLGQKLKESLLNRNNKVGPANVLRTLEPELFNFDEGRLASEELPNSYFHFLKSLNMSSSICLPLTGHNSLMGCLGFLRSSANTPFGQEELVVAQEIARPVAMAIQNANLHKKVNESEQKLSTIANTIPAPLAYVDHHGRLTFANASFLETFYLFEQKWENEKLSSALPINIHQEIKLRMPQLQAGAEQSFETNFVNLLGERRELEIKLVPKRDLKTKGGWFLIFIQDQTESKKAKLLLQSSKEAAEAANIAKSQFLANMSHEIRTPLGSMMGFAEMIKYYGDSLETTKEWSQKILNCGHHLLEIVNNVLDLAKVEADKIETTIEVFDFKSFMRELEESFPSNKDVALKVSIHPSTPAYLKSDKTLLRQILFNIIGNALKFTERGEVEASVAFQEKDSLLNIKVKDTGPGMSPEQTSKLFKRFSQLDGSNQRKHDGTGLGLVLAQRMARTLGGDVVLAATEPGKGSTFCAKAQVEPAASPLQTITPQCRPQTELVESKALLLKNLNIFIIDDSEDFRFLLSSFFNALGVKIKTFAEGEKAISALREFSVDMIFLDLQMPHMDGYKVKEKLRQSHYDGPILACTANAMKADKERALAAGFSDYITKPVKMEILIDVTIKHLQEARAIN